MRLRDPAARSELETLLTYPGVHALIWHRIAHRLWRADWKFAGPADVLARPVPQQCRHSSGGEDRHSASSSITAPCVVIGETAEIGDDVTLYHGVTLGGTSW